MSVLTADTSGDHAGAAVSSNPAAGASYLSNPAVGTMCWWLYRSGTVEDLGMGGIGNSANNNDFIALGGTCEVRHSGSTQFKYDIGNTPTTANTWVHVCLRVNSSGNSLWLDGVQQSPSYTTGSSATQAWISGLSAYDRISFGRFPGNVERSTTGSFAEAAIWNTDLADNEIVSLANGLSPLAVRSHALEWYSPLLENTTAGVNIMARTAGQWSLTGSPSAGQAMRKIVYPSQVQVFPATAGGGGGGSSVPVYMNHYRQMRAA